MIHIDTKFTYTRFENWFYSRKNNFSSQSVITKMNYDKNHVYNLRRKLTRRESNEDQYLCISFCWINKKRLKLNFSKIKYLPIKIGTFTLLKKRNNNQFRSIINCIKKTQKINEKIETSIKKKDKKLEQIKLFMLTYLKRNCKETRRKNLQQLYELSFENKLQQKINSFSKKPSLFYRYDLKKTQFFKNRTIETEVEFFYKLKNFNNFWRLISTKKPFKNISDLREMFEMVKGILKNNKLDRQIIKKYLLSFQLKGCFDLNSFICQNREIQFFLLFFFHRNGYLKEISSRKSRFSLISYSLLNLSKIERVEILLGLFFKSAIKVYKQQYYFHSGAIKNFLNKFPKKSRLELGFLYLYFKEISIKTEKGLLYFKFDANRFTTMNSCKTYIKNLLKSSFFCENFFRFINQTDHEFGIGILSQTKKILEEKIKRAIKIFIEIKKILIKKELSAECKLKLLQTLHDKNIEIKRQYVLNKIEIAFLSNCFFNL